MGLFSPWWLAGLAALGLPLWLHLLRQSKRTPQPFSSVMFIEPRVQSSLKHRRLRYLLLLTLRMLLLILLALAFANPYVFTNTPVGSRKNLTVIAIDKSFSMRYGDRMDKAKAEAHSLLSNLPGGARAQIAAFDSHLETLTQPGSDKGPLSAAIDAIQPDDLPSSYGELTRALRMLQQNDGAALHAEVITDAQATSMPPDFHDLLLGSHTTLQVHAVATDQSPNWDVSSVTTDPRIYDVKNTRLTATISGFDTPAENRQVTLLINNKPVSQKNVAVPASGRAQVEFTGFDVPYGANRGEIRIEPHDKLPQDDSFLFSMDRTDPQKVLFLYSAGRGKDAFYYKAALESSNTTGFTVQAAPLEQARYDDFKKYAFVVLNDPGNLNSDLAMQICDYISQGGSVLLALGPNSEFQHKAPLSSVSYSVDRVTQGAGYVDEQTPALSGVGKFSNVQFFHSFHVKPKPTTTIYAKLADGSPLIMEDRMGEGRLLTFASALDNTTNDMPLHASFLPFAVQTARYLSGASDTPSSVAVGTPVVLRRNAKDATAADVLGPQGAHELSFSESTKALAFDLTRTGFYTVQPAGGHQMLYAVHPDPRESDLKTIPAETLNLWRNTGNTSSTAENASATSQPQRSSWAAYVLLFLLIASIVETFFASRYLRQEGQTA
jgi:hypothetical protein